MNEIYTRVINLIGEEQFNIIRSKTVLIAGLGGVGGYALEALVRSGIGRVVIIDKDVIDITNLNRQIIATKNTIGQAKTDAFKKRIKEIDQSTEVVAIDEFISEDNLEEIFSYGIDYVIDAIDTMTSKISLWKYCQQHNIPFISSLGMARKIDPTQLKITTLAKTEYDPMAKALRSLARKNELSLNIPVVFTEERPLENSLNQKYNLGSMIFVPATAGLLAANYIILDIIDKQERKCKILSLKGHKMKVIIGLGNPGAEYEKTRHNSGFMVIDKIANLLNVSVNKKEHQALTGKITYKDQQVVLLKPQTYMNNSGIAVSSFINYYHVDIDDILVIYDDLDLKYGQLRLRCKGSAGGHNGIKSIISYLSTDNFKRIRIGIQKNHQIPVVDYVLGKIEKEYLDLYESSLTRAAKAAIDFIDTDFDKVMNIYNKEQNDQLPTTSKG